MQKQKHNQASGCVFCLFRVPFICPFKGKLTVGVSCFFFGGRGGWGGRIPKKTTRPSAGQQTVNQISLPLASFSEANMSSPKGRKTKDTCGQKGTLNLTMWVLCVFWVIQRVVFSLWQPLNHQQKGIPTQKKKLATQVGTHQTKRGTGHCASEPPLMRQGAALVGDITCA